MKHTSRSIGYLSSCESLVDDINQNATYYFIPINLVFEFGRKEGAGIRSSFIIQNSIENNALLSNIQKTLITFITTMSSYYVKKWMTDSWKN